MVTSSGRKTYRVEYESATKGGTISFEIEAFNHDHAVGMAVQRAATIEEVNAIPALRFTDSPEAQGIFDALIARRQQSDRDPEGNIRFVY